MKMNQLKAMRKNKKLTQAEVAQAFKFKDKSTVSKWETGGALPRIEILPKLAALYGVDESEIIKACTKENT